jgi:hypothetical protein
LHILNFVRAVSPQTAFRTFGKQIAYTWQSLDDYSIPEFTGKRMVLTVSHCKAMDVEGYETVCENGCKKLIPLFLNEQFKVKATFEPAGKSCTITLTPLNAWICARCEYGKRAFRYDAGRIQSIKQLPEQEIEKL